MRTRFKVLLKIIVVLIVLVLVALISFLFHTPSTKPTYKVIDNIKNYSYTLDDRDSKLMQDNFQDLKKILESAEIDYEEYAKKLSSLFIIDLFTLNNKDSKYDVGSTEYVYAPILDNYKLNVTDTIYKYIGEFAKNEYPEVNKINDVEVSPTTYKYQEEDKEGYLVNITWDYTKDLGYYKKGEIIYENFRLIKRN